MASKSDSRVPLVEALVTDLTRRLEAPSHNLVEASENALLDFIGCARGGVNGNPPRFPATSVETLAATLGILGSLLDRDDLHLLSLTHPGSVIWPTVLALGGDAAASGDELLRAAILGYEVVGRVGRALGPEHRRLWHATGTAGTIGAAAAAARVLRLDMAATVSAVGHATSLAAGSSQSFLEGSMTRLVHRASAACNGILAAKCAEAGLEATRFGLEGERALFAATSSVDRAPDILVAGDGWVIEETVHRYYASNGFAHAAIEAAAVLAPDVRAPIERIRLTLPETTRPVIASTSPRTVTEAWWSAPYAVCVTLAYGSDRLDDFDLLHDEAVLDLLKRTTVHDGFDGSSSVAVDGKVCTKSSYKGHPEFPLSRHELATKCRRLDPNSEISWESLRCSGQPPGVATTLTRLVLETPPSA